MEGRTDIRQKGIRHTEGAVPGPNAHGRSSSGERLLCHMLFGIKQMHGGCITLASRSQWVGTEVWLNATLNEDSKPRQLQR